MKKKKNYRAYKKKLKNVDSFKKTILKDESLDVFHIQIMLECLYKMERYYQRKIADELCPGYDWT